MPQEEFFDDAMLDKIKSADKKSNTYNEQDSKASRNIPQNIKDKKLPLKDKIKLTKPKEQ